MKKLLKRSCKNEEKEKKDNNNKRGLLGKRIKADDNNNNKGRERESWSGDTYINISKELTQLRPTLVVIVSKTEKLILALCYKTGKEATTIARLLNKSIAYIYHCLNNLTRQGLLVTSSIKRKNNRKYYIFKGTEEQLKKCPKDVIYYIDNYWSDKE